MRRFEMMSCGALVFGLVLAVPADAGRGNRDGGETEVQSSPSESSQARGRVMVRAASPDLKAIAERHDLEILQVIRDRGEVVALVDGPAWKNADEIARGVKRDRSVTSVETVELAGLPEVTEKAKLNQSFAAILESISMSAAYGTDSVAPFFGAEVWGGYVNQRLVDVIHLHEVREAPRPVFGSGVTVAVIDSGVDERHPLLAGSLVAPYDFLLDRAGEASEWSNLDQSFAAILEQSFAAILEQSFAAILEGDSELEYVNPSTTAILDQSFAAILESDDLPAAFGHGTMVAGAIRLVAPGAKIMPLRAFDGSGQGDMWSIVRAIRYAVDNGADLINMSFSIKGRSAELEEAILYAEAHGVGCIASAGNQGEEVVVYPAAFPTVIGVASSSLSDEASSFSNFGADLIDVTAPGEAIVTTYPGGLFAGASGTSFSAPLVSGLAALVLEARGISEIRLAPSVYRKLMDVGDEADDVGRPRGVRRRKGQSMGKGRINAKGPFEEGNLLGYPIP